MNLDDGYPAELGEWVERLEYWERLRSEARARADNGYTISPSQVTNFLLIALSSGVIGNVGYELLKQALQLWRRPKVRLPEQARTMADALLVAVLATQARCAQVELPLPMLDELEAADCARTDDGWRVELRRIDHGSYVRGERRWPDGVALGATVLIPDGPLQAAQVQVKVVAKREIDEATQAEWRRINEFIERLRGPRT